MNLALRVDLRRSKIPPLEYYCEYNGERDFLSYLYSPAIGQNCETKIVTAGTRWTVYGDLLPWEGESRDELYKVPMLSNVAP